MSKPAYIAYTVKDKKDGKKSFFHKVGAMWPNKKGDGFNLILDSLPLGAEIVLLPPNDDVGN